MLKKSGFLKGGAALPRTEVRFLRIWGILQIISGLLFLFIPSVSVYLALIMAASWLLIICMALALFRAIFHNRGFADTVMCICLALFFAVCSWAVSNSDPAEIEGYRLAICFALIFTGISRILAFAQLMERVNLPMLLFSGILESAAAVIMVSGWPSYNAFYLYFITGILIVISGVENFTELAKAKAAAESSKKKAYYNMTHRE